MSSLAVGSPDSGFGVCAQFSTLVDLLECGDSGALIPLGDVVLESLALPQRSARFALTLLAAETGEHLGATFEYNTDLFDATTIERLSQQFEQLLESIVTAPQTALSWLPILSHETRRLLATWNNTQREYPRASSS